VEGGRAGADQRQGGDDDQQPLREAELDQPRQHHSPPMPISAAFSAETPPTAMRSSPFSSPRTLLDCAPSTTRLTGTARKPCAVCTKIRTRPCIRAKAVLGTLQRPAVRSLRTALTTVAS